MRQAPAFCGSLSCCVQIAENPMANTVEVLLPLRQTSKTWLFQTHAIALFLENYLYRTGKTV